MKTTRRLLSIVLSMLIVVASMPMMYTSVTAAGTLNDPTTPVKEANPYEYEDLYKLNIKHSNNDFFFYQTIDNEYFVINQDLYLQQYTVALGNNRTLTFHGIDFYTGGSNLAEHSDNAGVIEEPAITTNETSDFLSKFYVSDSWTSTHTNTTNIDCTGEFNIAASGWDLNGRHMEYTWDHAIIFKGHSAETVGQINTSYYERATWDWDDGEGNAASMDFRIRTTITVVDARAFVNALAKAEDAIANPDEHSEGYVSAIQAIVNSIPADAKNLTGIYDQATLDAYANDINKVKEDAANYSEYNYLYSFFSSMTNDNGTYSGQSFTEFKQTIAQINANLSKELSATDQKVVDDAVAALRNAYETILVNNATLTPNVTHSETIQELTVTVGTEFNLIQVKDNQKFSLAQPWTIGHSKSQARKFAVVLDTSDANTNAFIARLDASSYGTQDFDNKALSQSGVTTFSCWDELDADGNFKDSSDFINEETRTINAGYDGFKNGNTYYLQSTPIFYGLSADESGATQYFYNQIFYVGWVNMLGFGGGSGSGTFTTTVNITDARPLVDAYEQAGIILSLEESNYTTNYLASLQAAYDAVPQDMVQGLKYYDQATVDATTKTLTDLLNNPETYADYTEYNKTKAEADAIINAGNDGVYAEDAFNSFVENVGNVDSSLAKDLTSVDQAIVDEATSNLDSLIAQLESNRYADYTELNNAKAAAQEILDNASIYTPESVEAVRNALAEANTVPENMVVGENNVNQNTIDAAADALNSIVNNAVVLDGDYTEYNNAKAELDELLASGNVDENGNPIYSEDVFTGVSEYVSNIDNNLDKNLKVTEQDTIDSATEAVNSAKAYLESNKYADYTDFNAAKDALEEIVNAPEGTYTDEIVQNAQDALDAANQIPADMVVGENNANQDIIDEATKNMQDVINSAKEKADYTDYNNAKNEADNLVNDDGNGNPIYDEDAFNAYKEAVNNIDNALNKDLSSDDQAIVDEATQGLADAKAELENNKLADYTDFDAAKDSLEEIVNAPAGTYTDETVQNAQDALDAANQIPADMVVGENNANQDIIDNATQNMQDVLDSAEKKADYTEFDKVVEDLEDIVNAPDGTYTDETVKNAQDALDSIVDVDKDLADTEQDILDEITSGLQDVINSAKEKADYTDYNNAKNEADNLVNDDGNGNPIYDEDAFNEYKEAVENVDNALNKGLSKEDQSIVDDATSSLENLKNTLEENKLADYTDFDAAKDALEEIVNAPAGTYTDETVQNAQNALDAANQIPADMVVGENNANQDIIDEATQNMQDVLDSAEKKADYTEFDKVVEDLEDIVNAPEGTYTDETVKKAQDALDSIVDVDKNLTESEQDVLDEITAGLKDVVDSAEKRADYTEFDKAVEDLEDIVNAPDGTYTDETVKNAQDALDSVAGVDKDLPESEQNTLDEITAGLKDVINAAKEKADYTDYNDAKNEADNLVNDDGNGNPIYDEDAFNEYKEAIENIDNALEKDLSKDDQSIVDDATSSLENLKNTLEENKFADYTDFDAVKDALEEIVNAPAGTYTDETVKNAQDALDNANNVPSDMVVGENNANQNIIDEATQNMQNVIDSAEKKADYTEFDKVVEDLEDIVNAPDGTYTDETVKNAQDALDSIVDVDKDLADTEQDILDEITSGLKDVLDSAKEKADYTDYNNAKNEADNLVNDDGNGNPIYDEDAFNEYKEAIENIDNALNKDLSKDDQSIVDDATSSLENLKTQLEEKKYYTVTYLDADGNVIGSDRFVAGSTFGALSAPALPEDTDAFAYVGWASEGALVSADDVLSGDVTVQIAREDKVLNLNNDALSIHTSTGYITSEVRDMTVAEFIAMFANDADCLEVKDLEGNVLASDDLVGTGAVITLKSKYTDNVYDSETVVVYGDVTGDGLVNADDYSKAKLANIIPGTYNADNYYFFVANDVMADGYIDALDTSYINLMVKGYK